MTAEFEIAAVDGEGHGRPARSSRALEEDIIFGRLAPGTRLTEDALLSRFRGDAALRAAGAGAARAMGIVVRERNKGATVRSLTATRCSEIYDGARAACSGRRRCGSRCRRRSALIDELTAIHEEHGRYIDEGYLRGVHEANDRFHLTLFGACGNKHLVQTIELYMRLSLPVRANSMGDAASLKVSHEHHRLMIEMLQGHATTGCWRSSASIICSRARGAISSRSEVDAAGFLTPKG